MVAVGVDREHPSPSSRRAWIEIQLDMFAPLLRWVALLAEGVDRNIFHDFLHVRTCVALLAEGVDRNAEPLRPVLWKARSPSSRRAWIEIHLQLCLRYYLQVALLAEGVDRNSFFSISLNAWM